MVVRVVVSFVVKYMFTCTLCTDLKQNKNIVVCLFLYWKRCLLLLNFHVHCIFTKNKKWDMGYLEQQY